MRRLEEPKTAPVTIELDGQPIAACEGENTACALLAARESIFSRSIKYHRPRGPFCLTGACAHCLMRVDGAPNIPVCQTSVHAGMRLERQNAFPTARVDVFAITDWLFPRGLNHHEMFAGVPVAEQVMAKVARQLAGLGTLPETAAPQRPAAATLRCEVAIIGAGAAGLAAAQVLDEARAPYLLIEREHFAGGRLLTAPEEPGAPALWAPPTEKVRLGLTAIGIFEDGDGRFLAVSDGEQLTKIYAQRLLLANGGHPQLLAFENNDLPGVFAARAVSRMIRVHRLLPGNRIAVVGDPDEAQGLAALIEREGGEAVAIGAQPICAHGLKSVNALTVKLAGAESNVDCDAIALCAPLAPSFELAVQAGAHVGWRDEQLLFAVDTDAEGRTASPTVFAAGELRGPMRAAAAAEGGRRAAQSLLGAAR